jgi:hypothetical protein
MEGITATLLSLCLAVNVSCNNVEVSFDDLNRNIVSKTIICNSGHAAIFVDNDVRLESSRLKEVLVYELTRIDLHRNSESVSRNAFRSKCNDFAKKAGIGRLSRYDLCRN